MLLDRKDLPSAGAVEAPIVATAPAIANFDASGQRLRALPLKLAWVAIWNVAFGIKDMSATP